VPGHERFVPNMLAGVGPAPAAMVVVAADGGWMPQSAEHLAALHALGVRHGLLVVTRADLADPAPARDAALARIAATSLGTVEAVAVSGRTGAGLPALRAALDRLVARLPAPDAGAPVRLWVDRAFTVAGSGTVVTGTLAAGAIAAGDTLALGGGAVRVRGLQSLGAATGRVTAVARVAVNLRGVPKEAVRRGDALLTPGAYADAASVDVRVHGDPAADLPAELALHIGSAAVAAAVRPLGADTARLRLARALPLRIGDRALLRDPGRRHVAGGVTVLDVAPPPLRRRGAAAARAAELSTMDGVPDLAGELRRRTVARADDLRRMGVPVQGEGWLVDDAHRARLRPRVVAEVERYAAAHPLEPGAPADALRHLVGLPDRAIVEALAREAGLIVHNGRVSAGATGLPRRVADAIATLGGELTAFQAPEIHRLRALGLGPRELAAAVRAGALETVADGVYLLPGGIDKAGAVLAALDRPFTLSEARQALDTTRRVAVPLLELLDRRGVTRRGPDDRRTVAP
jgi:selenocysteine-specific elongation factor